jgi:UDP-2,4-diacetamido-2,4,6-trideoxy-beta-L-altropyranose hydrolase
MKVWFRCDANPRVGSGHVMRCLTLADALAEGGAECWFLSAADSFAALEIVRARGHRTVCLAEDEAVEHVPAESGWPEPTYASWIPKGWRHDFESCRAALNGLEADWLVVDHYALDARWESAMRDHARRILVVDDLADRKHDCDALLDSNFGRKPSDYSELVPENCKVLAGSDKVLLRPEFVRPRGRHPDRVGVRRILVNMGGVDSGNASEAVIGALEAMPGWDDASITVLLGRAAPWIEQVRSRAGRCRRFVRVLVDAPDIAALMEDSDLAIGTGGTGVYERLFMGLPSVVMAIADNQVTHLKRMAAAGLFELVGSVQEIPSVLRRCQGAIPHPPRSVVGCGVAAVCHALAVDQLVLCRPSALDIRRSFAWLGDSALRASFLMRTVPTRSAHVQYWRALPSRDDQRGFSAYSRGRHVGNAGLKHIDFESRRAEVWLYLGSAADRGQGLGAQVLTALEAAARRLGIDHTYLHVGTENSVARRLYAASGYVEVGLAGSPDEFIEPVVRMEKSL